MTTLGQIRVVSPEVRLIAQVLAYLKRELGDGSSSPSFSSFTMDLKQAQERLVATRTSEEERKAFLAAMSAELSVSLGDTIRVSSLDPLCVHRGREQRKMAIVIIEGAGSSTGESSLSNALRAALLNTSASDDPSARLHEWHVALDNEGEGHRWVAVEQSPVHHNDLRSTVLEEMSDNAVLNLQLRVSDNSSGGNQSRRSSRRQKRREKKWAYMG